MRVRIFTTDGKRATLTDFDLEFDDFLPAVESATEDIRDLEETLQSRVPGIDASIECPLGKLSWQRGSGPKAPWGIWLDDKLLRDTKALVRLRAVKFLPLLVAAIKAEVTKAIAEYDE